METFKDLFSAQAQQYAQFRPGYPQELLKWVSDLPKVHDSAWDCGTGNGQTALGLTPYFKKIIATDASLEQIKNAQIDAKITYHTALSEKVPFINNHSVDLVTAATAAHWFNLDAFYQEVRRVLKPRSWVALWTYGHDRKVLDPKVNEVLVKFEEQEVGPYWAPEVQYVRDKYLSLPFPFEEISTPKFFITREMDLAQMFGYLSSWSATQKLIEIRGMDPVLDFQSRLKKVWGEGTHKMTWPIYLRVGRQV